MKRLWLWYMPLLFLPNAGFVGATGFGTLELSDLLIGPYLLLLLYSVRWGAKLEVSRLTPWLLLFGGWAFFTTITMPFRYDERVEYFLFFGLLKLAKMGLYTYAGVLTAKALASTATKEQYDWALVAIAVTVGLSLLLTRLVTSDTTGDGYTSTNSISIMGAMLLSYLGGRLIIGASSRRWRTAASCSLFVLVFGMAVSDGRGGWIAAIAAGVYLIARNGIDRRAMGYGILGCLAILLLYQFQAEFHQQVNMTLFASSDSDVYQGTRNVGSLDDGGRFQIWTEEAKKFPRSPWWGVGFYHRGEDTRLLSTGSHNFWLQMFLELGLLGGSLALGLVATMWRRAGAYCETEPFLGVPTKAVLIAALVGAMSEAYFYGGITLFMLFILYAPIGSDPVSMPTKYFGSRRLANSSNWNAHEMLRP